MKYLLLVLFLVSCSGSNEHGECVGFSDGDRDPRLEYEVSTRNAIWSFIGVETIIAPVLWATDYAYCPVGLKDVHE
jgi:hypothetical protein